MSLYISSPDSAGGCLCFFITMHQTGPAFAALWTLVSVFQFHRFDLLAARDDLRETVP